MFSLSDVCDETRPAIQFVKFSVLPQQQQQLLLMLSCIFSPAYDKIDTDFGPTQDTIKF